MNVDLVAGLLAMLVIVGCFLATQSNIVWMILTMGIAIVAFAIRRGRGLGA